MNCPKGVAYLANSLHFRNLALVPLAKTFSFRYTMYSSIPGDSVVDEKMLRYAPCYNSIHSCILPGHRTN